MALRYETGEEIRKGDRVLFHGNPGQIELVADPDIPDPETNWYLREDGPGVLVNESREFGRVYVTPQGAWEDLEFVSRQEASL